MFLNRRLSEGYRVPIWMMLLGNPWDGQNLPPSSILLGHNDKAEASCWSMLCPLDIRRVWGMYWAPKVCLLLYHLVVFLHWTQFYRRRLLYPKAQWVTMRKLSNSSCSVGHQINPLALETGWILQSWVEINAGTATDSGRWGGGGRSIFGVAKNPGTTVNVWAALFTNPGYSRWL